MLGETKDTIYKPWTYRGFDRKTAPSVFGQFSKLVELWVSKTPPNEPIPERSSFDFYDVTEWLGYLSIAEVQVEPYDIRFVLWGTELTEWWGVDYTNKSLRKKPVSPNIWEPADKRYHKLLTEQQVIGLATGPLDAYGSAFKYVCALDLPLGNSNQTTHLLSAYRRVKSIADVDLDVTPEFTIGPIGEYSA